MNYSKKYFNKYLVELQKEVINEGFIIHSNKLQIEEISLFYKIIQTKTEKLHLILKFNSYEKTIYFESLRNLLNYVNNLNKNILLKLTYE